MRARLEAVGGVMPYHVDRMRRIEATLEVLRDQWQATRDREERDRIERDADDLFDEWKRLLRDSDSE